MPTIQGKFIGYNKPISDIIIWTYSTTTGGKHRFEAVKENVLA